MQYSTLGKLAPNPSLVRAAGAAAQLTAVLPLSIVGPKRHVRIEATLRSTKHRYALS